MCNVHSSQRIVLLHELVTKHEASSCQKARAFSSLYNPKRDNSKASAVVKSTRYCTKVFEAVFSWQMTETMDFAGVRFAHFLKV
jgi:hypothetical protein